MADGSQHPGPKRNRNRLVSPERIRRVVAELSKDFPHVSVQLLTDGSAVLLTADVGANLVAAGEGGNDEW